MQVIDIILILDLLLVILLAYVIVMYTRPIRAQSITKAIDPEIADLILDKDYVKTKPKV